MLKSFKVNFVIRVDEEIHKQLNQIKGSVLEKRIRNHIIEDVINRNNESKKLINYVKLILFQHVIDQYKDFAHEDKISITEAYENGLDFYAKMRNGGLNPEEIEQADKMMMR